MTLPALERVVLHHHTAARQDGVDLAIDHPAFPCAVVHVHVVLVVDADLGLLVRVPHHYVGIGTGGDDALLRIQTEHASRRGAAGLHPTLQRDLTVHHTLVQQFHAVLNATDAIGDGGEVAEAQFLLILHAERAVIGADDGELVHAQALPQVALVAVAHLTDVVRVVVLAAHRRAAHPLGAFETGLAQRLFQREVQVLRAGLGEHIAAMVAGGGDLVEGIAGTHVHDVQRHVAGHVAQHDGAVRGLGLQRRGTGVAVVLRVGLATGEGLLHQHVDGDAVLGVHHDHGAAFGSGLHGTQDLTVVAVEHAGVRHEQLEAADALVLHEVLHVLQRLVVDTADDLVERVVDGTVALGLAMPLSQAIVHVLAVALHCHVDDGGGATPRSSVATGLEGVAGKRAAEGQLHVRVHIDATGDHVLPRSIDDLGHALFGEVTGRTNCGDRAVGNEHVLSDGARRGDDEAVLDESRGHVIPPCVQRLDQRATSSS